MQKKFSRKQKTSKRSKKTKTQKTQQRGGAGRLAAVAGELGRRMTMSLAKGTAKDALHNGPQGVQHSKFGKVATALGPVMVDPKLAAHAAAHAAHVKHP